MISILPLKIPASADEPGFSVLARNTAINASRTEQEFCTVTGLSKAGICAGNHKQLDRLASLTGSDLAALEQNSPHQLNRRFSILHGQQFLTRSLRKEDLAVCPVCWLEVEITEPSELHLQRNWLPRPLQTCATHEVALISLPYADYTSCYDHIIRAGLDRGWMDQLSELVESRRLSSFERSAIEQIETGTPICDWIGDVQIDVVERWCLGLGHFVKWGVGNPDRQSEDQRRAAIRTGFAITKKGVSAVFEAVDKALCRHRLRLSKTWLHNWALLSLKPPERQFFRDLMRQLCADQGQFCLSSISQDVSIERYVDAKILDIAQASNRHNGWVRKALVRDDLLPSNGKPLYVNLEQHMQKCLAHILELVRSLDATKSAKKLNIGIKGFEALAVDKVIRPIRSTTHEKWRFRPEDIDAFAAQIAEQLSDIAPLGDPPACSIHQACFAYGCTTPQVIRLILTGQLDRSYQVQSVDGIVGIRIIRSDLAAKLPIFTSEHLAPFKLTERLGLEYAELKLLHQLNLLPYYPTPKGLDRRIRNSVSTIILDQFLGRFQTVRSAANILYIEESELQKRISKAGISPAPDAGGLPVYRASDLLDF